MTSALPTIATTATGLVPALFVMAKSTLVLIAALGITSVLRRRSAGARHLVWLTAMGALLVLPALEAWSPWRLTILPESFSPRAAQPESNLQGRADPFAITSPVQNASVDSPAASKETEIGISTPVVPSLAHTPAGLSAQRSALVAVVATWAAIVLVVVGWLAHASFLVRRIVARATPLDNARWRSFLYEVADRLGLDHAPRLLRSEDSKMPFACGFVRATIVLPAESDEWTDSRCCAVLLHELGHVRRRDLLGHTLARVACAVYWFHPLVWTAARRLRIESERACDDLAITSGARASEYAEHLLDIVTRVRQQRTPAVAIPMAQRKEFEGRMLAILDPELARRGPSRAQSLSLAGVVAVLALLVSAAAPARSHGAQVSGTPGSLKQAAHRAGDDSLGVVRSSGAERNAPRKSLASDSTSSPSPAPSASPSPSASLSASPSPSTSPAPAGTNGVRSEQDPIGAAIPQARGNKDDRAALLATILRTDSSTKLRRVAAWGLAQYADQKEASEALASAVRRDRSAVVREMAAWALASGSGGESDVVEALSDALRRDSEMEVRETAAWTLGGLGRDAAAPALTEALGSDDAKLRAVAAWALGDVGLQHAPRELIRALRDKDPKVRHVVAWALYNIEDADAVPELEAAMDRETEKELRVDYIRALAAMGERSAGALAKLLESKDNDVREIAVTSLAGGHAGGPWPWPWPRPRPFP